MLIEGYLETHKKIVTQVDVITKLIGSGSIEENAMSIGREVSKLSGMINVHLNSEDGFLYPKMMQSSDSKVQTLAKRYQDEMGGLVDEFNEFKSKYNTKGRILENEANLAKEWNAIVRKLSQRIGKEEKELYKNYQE